MLRSNPLWQRGTSSAAAVSCPFHHRGPLLTEAVWATGNTVATTVPADSESYSDSQQPAEDDDSIAPQEKVRRVDQWNNAVERGSSRRR